ncbi:MAG: hypothetical protein JRI23_22760 [Deltaproteobacteria bacterium]|jgi:hypothetical protein|nr:hypothetical protein [Deltaproteobacteria bacterium]MBW2534790.1 hypothetical protein [Deltaproteobacteria bacterium]
MKQTLARHVPFALTAAVVAGLSLTAGCESCPDLWYRAFEIELFGADPTQVFLTATEENTGEVPCDDRALAENCLAGPGVYTLSFEFPGPIFREVNGVCTLGNHEGCPAEDAEAQGPPPLIRVERDSTTGEWNVTVERDGTCPQ